MSAKFFLHCFMGMLTVFFIYNQTVAQDHADEGEANRYMHQSSIETLISHFDDPERDQWQKPELIIEKLGDLEDKTVMDLGSGSGYFTFRLAAKAAKVIAADVDEEFLNHIREEIAGMNSEEANRTIELRKIPYDNPLLKEEEVDCILIVNTYHHINDRVNYFKQAYQGLRTKGILMIVDFKLDTDFGPPADHKVGLEVVENEIAQIGFDEILIDESTLEYQYIVTCIKN